MSLQVPDISEFREVPHDEGLVEDQNELIRKVQEQIAELPELMAEMREFIEEQGILVEEAEENIEEVVESVEEGVIQLKAALREKEKSRKIYWYGGGGAVGGAGLGALGFLGGPAVGAGTTIVSTILGLAAGTFYGAY